MKKKNPEAKIAQKKQIWIERTSKILDVSEDEATKLLSIEKRQSIRVRGCEIPLDIVGGQFDWYKDGYRLAECLEIKDIRDNPLVMDGSLYIQNAASWLPVLVLDPQDGEVILDVCAAPGGKTSHIYDLAPGSEIWSNDNSRARLAKLQANMDRLHVPIARYTLHDASQLARKLDGHMFDKILLDAPCSGEGMMNLSSNKDFNSWSVAHIKRLQTLQKQILRQAWQLLKPGGTLIYSTCTMAPEENEMVVDYLLRHEDGALIRPIGIQVPNKVAPVLTWNGKQLHPDIVKTMRLKPSPDIEAFFVCRLTKKV